MLFRSVVGLALVSVRHAILRKSRQRHAWPLKDLQSSAPTWNAAPGMNGSASLRPLRCCRDDLHSTLQFARARAASEVHGRASIEHGENHFPQVAASELPMSAVAHQFHQSGPPLL